MQNRKDCMGKVAGLVGDAYFDWLTEEYFSPLCNQAYEQAIMYLEGTCSPFIEKVVIVPAVTIGVDDSNLVPYGVKSGGGQITTYPLNELVEPRYVDFRPTGGTQNWKPVKECTILPDAPTQVTPGTFDIRVRGDFRPAPLTTDDSIIEIHPLASHALAFSIGALIGMERPNEGWVENYGTQAKDAWDRIASKLVTQQQRLPFRLGSPNRGGQSQRRSGFNLQSNMGFEWRSFGLYLQLI